VTAHIKFFNTVGSNNLFYTMVARPLLSMSTVGSMDVERMVKPVKHTIMTKHCNRLRIQKGLLVSECRRIHEKKCDSLVNVMHKDVFHL
jgi:hypothetical protein